jgi:uncharacterized membrane protein
MIRTLMWLVAGVLLGGIIHITVILAMPAFASDNAWQRVGGLNATDRIAVLAGPRPGEPNPLHLDPDLTYAVCRLDLETSPGVVSGTLPDTFWSVAIYNSQGTVVYSTTNRDGIGTNLDLGIFNPQQTQLLAHQKLEISDGLLIVESPENQVFVVVRLAPPHEAMRTRYERALAGLSCGNIGDATTGMG